MGRHTGHDHPHDEHEHGGPEHDRPGHDDPEHGRPEHDHPEHDRPGHDHPEHDHPEHDHPVIPLPPRLREVEGRPGGVYVCERGTLLAAWSQAGKVRELLQSLEVECRADTERVGELDVAQLQVAEDRVPVPDLIDELRDQGGPDLVVAPNHALVLGAHASWIPVAAPRPADRREALYEQPGLPGEGVTVGVLDTGAWNHPYFAGRVDFRHPEDVDEPDADGDGALDYPAGHGTFIAGVVLRHAPRARVLARRLPTNAHEAPHCGYVTDAELASTLARTTELRDVDVLSLSVGGYTHDGMGLIATQRVLTDYLAHNPDLVVVAGAGNDNRSDPFFPAAMKRVVAVAALDGSGGRACFSNHGWWVDACAPGTDVHGPFVEWEGELAPYPAQPPGPCAGKLPAPPGGALRFDGWARWDGTSFAAPAVAGAIAARISEGRTGREAVFDVVHAPGCHRLPGLGTVVNPRSYP